MDRRTPLRLLRSLPNLLSAARLAAAPALLALAFAGRGDAFLAVLVATFASDALDGFLARRSGGTSELGARLDSAGDLATWLVLPLCTWWLRPDFVLAELPWIAGLAAALLLPVGAALLKFGRVPSYHTWGAKLAAVALATALVVVYADGPVWPFWAAALLAGASQLEELLITAVLPRWRADVPSLRHALRLR